MKRAISILSACLLALAFATVTMAQDTGRLNGQIFDKEGKPYPDVTVTLKNTDTGQTYTVKTDKDGKFVQLGIRGGTYTITSTNEKDSLNFSEKIPISLDHENDYKLNIKDLLAKQGASPEAKKAAEEEDKFKTMKTHFDAGVVAITDANNIRTQLRTATPDQKSALNDKRTTDCTTAVTEFTAAEQGVQPNDTKNHALVWGNLGQAQECVGKYEDATKSFQSAIDLTPTAPYYTELATSEADLGAGSADPKSAETDFANASASCDKAIALDPVAGAVCWKNLGIVLSNKGRMKDAIVPLQKATTADSKDAVSWLLLGNALTATIEPKQEGEKITYIIPPGTADAYQKAISLAPGTPIAKQAQDALDGLNAISGGQDTRIGTKKKKS